MNTLLKRMLSFAFALVMILSLIPMAAPVAHAAEADTSWYDAATGTEEDPYIIDSKEDLFGLVQKSKTSTFYERVIKLAANIDLAGETWQPIGFHGGNTSAEAFEGTFDGCGYTISNLTITVSSKGWQGLFGQVSGTIKNLNLTGANISGTSSYSYHHGCVVGQLADKAILENVHVTASTIAVESYYVGGLVGSVQKNAQITGCSFSGTVDGRTYIGGLVGFVNSSANLTLTNSTCSGTVMATKLKSTDSTSSLGGLVGQIKNANATITNCSNSALVSCALEKSNRGTIIGDVYNSTVTLTNVTNKNKDIKDLAGFNITSGSANSVTGEVTCGHDYVDGICSICGAEEPVSITTFDFLGTNMALNNSLAMNFAFSGTHYNDWTGFYAKIVKEYADGREAATLVIAAENWEKRGSNYVVTYPGVAAKEMADTFQITIYNAQDQAVSVTRTDSVRAYARRTLDNPATAQAVKAVVVDMLNYGAAAQVYFNYGTGDLANSGLTADEQLLASGDILVSDGRVTGEHFAGSLLGLESNIQLSMSFAGVTEGMTAKAVFTDAKGASHTVSCPITLLDGYGKVSITALAVADYDCPVEVTIYNADTSVYDSASDSVASYVARNNATDDDTVTAELKALGKALVKFADSACKYFVQ